MADQYDMSGVHSANLKILKEVDRICRKYKIRYGLDAGTLIGAVRHHGFIPWDDDADVYFTRSQYEAFCKVAPRELPEGISRQAEDDVAAGQNATSGGAFHRIDGSPESMPAVDAAQGFIASALYAVLHQEKGLFVYRFQITQQFIGHAVGAGTDDKTYDSIYRQGFFVLPFQSFQFAIGIGVCLEIGKILHLGIFVGKEVLSFFQLPGDGFLSTAIVGVESLVIAIGATAVSFHSVAIGTGEAGIQRYLLYLVREVALQEERKFIVKRLHSYHSILSYKYKTFDWKFCLIC